MVTIRLIAFTLALQIGGLLAQPPSVRMPKKHADLFAAHCVKCHGEAAQEGKVNLENVSFELNTIESAELWQKILGAINSGEMPPQDEEPLPAGRKTTFLEDLSQTLVNARRMLSDSGGVITMRRLNRREYVNTIRELLGVDVDARDLPDDSNAGGFDTAGASLFFSSDQLEQYLAIARRALDDAIVTGDRPKPHTERRQAEESANRTIGFRARALQKKHVKAEQWKKSDKPPTDFGFIDAARVKFEEGQYKLNYPFYAWYLAAPESQDGAMLAKTWAGSYVDVTDLPMHTPSGAYLLRVRCGVLEDAKPHQRFLEIGRQTDGRTGELDVFACRRVTGTREAPQTVEIPITLSGESSRKIGLRERQTNSRTAARLAFREAQRKNGVGPSPALWIDWVEWTGPLYEQWPPAAHSDIFFRGQEGDESDEYVTEILDRFATRAFRGRKPATSFVARLQRLYEQQIVDGHSFEVALKEPLAVILASPGFLYLREPAPAAPAQKALADGGHGIAKHLLSDSELAVRLSYFLWSAPPDEALLQLAEDGDLNNPETLRQETNRLLADARAHEFIAGFAHQWLNMERLDFFQFNASRYPEFDDSVKAAAREEIYQTILFVLRENLSIEALLKSDFVVINDLLADYYGIEGVTGPEFRRVDLPSGSVRGGLLGTAAVLAMGSDGERSSPVERGAWVLRKLLHDPPPPAPANVPQLSRLADKVLSAREMQAAHMEEPQCAQCHRKIDPIGYGLQNFDAAGRWRTEETIFVKTAKRKSVKHTFPIDSSGTLSDGSPFVDYLELRDRISERSQAFARGLTEALIEYGLGRPYGFSDYDLAETIIRAAASKDYQLRAVIHALVESDAFRRK